MGYTLIYEYLYLQTMVGDMLLFIMVIVSLSDRFVVSWLDCRETREYSFA